MTDTGKQAKVQKKRKLTQAEKDEIRSELRKKYGDPKILTPAFMMRVGSMFLIILFSIGIIINMRRRAKASANAKISNQFC